MITIIASTNRSESSTLKLAKYYQKLIQQAGLTANLLSLQQLPPNFIETDMFGKRSSAFQPLQDMMTDTQKFLFVIPEYNGSFPGVLKAFIDACAFPDSFYEKKAALVGLSSGKYGNVRGVEHFTGICSYVNLYVLPLRLHIPAIHKEFDIDGNLYQPDTIKFVNQQVEKFIAF